jgi:hypothetical protein
MKLNKEIEMETIQKILDDVVHQNRSSVHMDDKYVKEEDALFAMQRYGLIIQKAHDQEIIELKNEINKLKHELAWQPLPDFPKEHN